MRDFPVLAVADCDSDCCVEPGEIGVAGREGDQLAGMSLGRTSDDRDAGTPIG